jgi:hypothetical protein
MPQIGRLSTQVVAETQPFERGMRRASTATDMFGRRIKSTGNTLKHSLEPALGRVGALLMNPVTGVTAALAAASAGTQRLFSVVRDEAEKLDAIGKLSSRIGVSTEDLTALQHAANLTGVSFEKVQKGLQSFSKRTGEAAMGTGEALKAFEQLNINAEEFVKLPMIERLAIIADRLQGFSTQAEKAAIAAKLFSDAGKGELLNLLDSGADGLRSMAAEAKRLGLVMGDDLVKAVEASNDALTRATAIGQGYRKQVAAELSITIGALIEQLDELDKKYQVLNKLGQESGQTPGRTIVDTLSTIMAAPLGGVGLLGRAGLEQLQAKGDQMVEEERTKRLENELRKLRDKQEKKARDDARRQTRMNSNLESIHRVGSDTLNQLLNLNQNISNATPSPIRVF